DGGGPGIGKADGGGGAGWRAGRSSFRPPRAGREREVGLGNVAARMWPPAEKRGPPGISASIARKTDAGLLGAIAMAAICARPVPRRCPPPPAILARFMTLVALALAAMVTSSVAQEPGRPPHEAAFAVPVDVSERRATIWSDGTRMAAHIYAPKSASGRLPTIIMAYGWGGTMERLRPEAAAFSQAGYLVVAFDHLCWGGHESQRCLCGAV